MAISAAILMIVSAILWVAFDVDIYLCALLTLAGGVLLYFRSKLKEIWNTLTIQGTIFHPQIFSEHMPTGKRLSCLRFKCVSSFCWQLLVCLFSYNVMRRNILPPRLQLWLPQSMPRRANSKKASAAADMQLPTKSDTSAGVPAPVYNEYTADTQDDSSSPIYKGKSYEDVLNEVSDQFPAATYALFDMTADDNPELVVKTGTSQSTARYDVYSLQDGDTQYLGSIDGAYTELCPISSYYALLAVKDNGSHATLSLIVYQDGGLTSIEAFDGSSSDIDSYESLNFTPVRKYDASQWTTNPSTMNDWFLSSS